MRNMLPNLPNTHATNVSSHDPRQIPSIRLISATPSAAGLSIDASTSFTRSFENSWVSASPSIIFPKPDAPTRKRLVPKKSKLGLLGVASRDEAKHLSGNANRDRTSTRRSFDIHIDQINDPELEDVIVVKRQKSRGVLNGLKWDALGEVTNVSDISREGPASSDTLKVNQDKKWWSIGRGRKNSKETKGRENRKENELHAQSLVNQSKTCSNSFALPNSNFPHAKVFTASEETPRPCRPQRSFTPELLEEAFHASSPPPRSASPVRNLNDAKDQGSIALRAIRSVKSLARLGGWSHIRINENGAKEGTVKGKSEKERKEKGGEKKDKDKREKGGEDKGQKKDKDKREKGGEDKGQKKDKDKKEKRGKKREHKEVKESREGTLLLTSKRERKEDKEKREKRGREKKNEATLCLSSSSFEAGSLTKSPDHADNTQTLRRKKHSILGLGLSFRSSVRLPSARSGSTASSIFLQPNRPSLDALGSRAKERMGSTMSTASSLRPVSVTSSSGVSVSNRQSRGSVKWDEEGLQSDRREIQREKKEKRKKKEKEEGRDSMRSGEGKRRILITDVFPEVASSKRGNAIDADQGEEIHKRFSTAFPIATIEEAARDGREDDTEEIHDSIVYGGILKESETKYSPQMTLVKRPRARPMSELLLGKLRPCVVYEDDEDVLSILDAATNDLAQLINNLDLEATPSTPDIPLSRPVSKSLNDKFNGSPVKRARRVTASPSAHAAGELGLRPSTTSISSLRPYAQSRGKATKTLTTPVFTSPVNDTTGTTKPSEFSLDQPIKPWPVLLQQISPIKECHDVKRGDEENMALNNLPSKTGTWKRGHKRTMTPGPEPEPGPIFQPLRPPKARVPRTSDASEAKSTHRASVSSIFVLPTEASSNKGLGGLVSPPSSFSRKANALLRKRCSLLPVPIDVLMGDTNLACSDSSSNLDTLHSSSNCALDDATAEKRRTRMPTTLGDSDVSCYAVPVFYASDPDCDIPNELQDVPKANTNGGSDDDTFELNKHFIRNDNNSADVEYPRSNLPPLDSVDLPSDVLSPPVFDVSLGSNAGILGDIDGMEHVDAEFDPDVDTRQSFDFTGELRRLNQSSASDRCSFFEQLECAFKTPAMLDLRCDLGGLLQVQVPPVPHLPPDFNVCRKTSLNTSSDNSQSVGGETTDDPKAAEEHMRRRRCETDGEPEAFDVSKTLNVKAPSAFDIQSIQSIQSADSNVKRFVPCNVQRPPPVNSLDLTLEIDSANVTGCVIVSADPTEDMRPSHPSNQSTEARPLKGELNKSFRFGEGQNAFEQSHHSSPPLTLSDIIPPLGPLSESSASSERAFGDNSLFKSILTKEPDPPQLCPRVASDAGRRLFQAQESIYHHSHASISSFTGLDSFEEVRRGFEFNSQRPGFYPPPAASSTRADCHVRDSVMSIASVSSYGWVINPGIPDPFDFGLPSLQERPLPEDLSTSFSIDDTFSFLKHPFGTRKRVDSDASSFYFHAPASRPRDRRCEPTFSVTSQAPSVNLFKKGSATHRNESNGGIGSRPFRGQYHRFNVSTDSVTSDLSAMRLERPGLGDKMFDTVDQALPLSSISPTSSLSRFSPSQMFNQHQSTFDSILDGDRRISMDVPDSIFDKTGQRTSVISENSVFGRDDDACIQPGNLSSYQFRPLSFVSEASVHSPVKDDDTMISMLGGGRVRRRSIGSIMSGSPCARVEKRKHATLQGIKGAVVDQYVSLNKTGTIEKPTTLISPFHTASEYLPLTQHHPQQGHSLEESCLVGRGEDKSTLLRPVPVFTRPPPASRSRPSTLTSFGDDTPPLSACDGTSVSGSSLSSLDQHDVDTMFCHTAHSISTRQHVCSRARARGHDRRRYSHVRSSRTGSIYETIQEELASAQSSPVPSIVPEKSTNTSQVLVADGDTTSVYSTPDDPVSLWDDDERDIAALRRYHTLQDEAQSTVMESKRVWLDTPFSIFAVQSFNPPHHLEGMKALLEDSLQNYGPLPSELRPRRMRSRKDARPSPYPQLRPVKFGASSETLSSPTDPESVRCPTAVNVQQVSTNKSGVLRPANLPTPRVNRVNSPIKYKQGTIRVRVGSNARRSALGRTQRNGVKEFADTFGVLRKLSTSTNTTSTDQKENLAGMGSVLISESSLRFHRPRPKGRPINPKPAQRPIKI